MKKLNKSENDQRIKAQNFEVNQGLKTLLSLSSKVMNFPRSNQEKLLINLLQCIQKNAENITQIDRMVENYFVKLANHTSQLVKMGQNTVEDDEEKEVTQEETNEGCLMLNQLFGRKKYRYRFRIVGDFPSLLYKERNFTFKIQLTNNEGISVRNSNILNISLGVCDIQGKWILENKMGDPFLKGKTEVQMYLGEALFEKVYARDISRHYKEGKIILVVYCKPSTLVYCGETNYDEVIKENQIQPLLIQEVSIKSKRKE